MPIYEFYCRGCHTIFSFLSRSVDSRKRPACPRCGKSPMERRVSAFAVSRGLEKPSNDPAMHDVDESRMERAMETLTGEADGLDDEDPRAMARLMHRFYDHAGLRLGEGMQEALRRMEAGEDPDEVEKEMEAILESEDPLFGGQSGGLRRLRRRARPPDVDDTLYEL